MSNLPLVSINVTTYNRAHLLGRCLKSIQMQDYSNFEVVVVDDGSQDDTCRVVEQFIQDDSRIRLVRHTKNLGNAHARNSALNECKGEFVAFMDDDDEWIMPHKLSRQVALFLENESHGVGLICSSVKKIDKYGAETSLFIAQPKDPEFLILRGNGFIFSPTVLTSRKIMKEAGGFETNLPRGIDSDFYRTVIVKLGYKVFVMPEFTTAIHEYGEDRMTPRHSVEAFRKDILGNIICLQKFQEDFHRYPAARRSRKLNLLRRYLVFSIRNFHLALRREIWEMLRS